MKYAATVPASLSKNRYDITAVALFPTLSRGQIKAIIDQGGAYLNGKRIYMAKFEVAAGDRMELHEQPKNAHKPSPLTPDRIVFENEFFIVLNKPAHMPSCATQSSTKGHVLDALHLMDPQKYPKDRLFLVHRLDKETSGLMLIAKDGKTQSSFETKFR